MTDWNIASGASQPINRTGFENIAFAGEDVQATPVGIVADGSGGYELAKADADSAEQVNCVGVLLQEEVIDASTLPTGTYFQDLEEQLVHEYRTLQGDRCTLVFEGVELVNDDDDTSWTPGEPVYLDVGGGFTQTKPSTSGELVQAVGVALTPDFNGDGKDRMYLRVGHEYETLA